MIFPHDGSTLMFALSHNLYCFKNFSLDERREPFHLEDIKKEFKKKRKNTNPIVIVTFLKEWKIDFRLKIATFWSSRKEALKLNFRVIGEKKE